MANSVPTLTGLTTPVTFLENTVNAAPQIIDADVAFTDPDDNFDGGTLTVSGLIAEDRWRSATRAPARAQIGIAGGNVSFGGTVIGSFTGGAGSTLTVTFNASATAAADRGADREPDLRQFLRRADRQPHPRPQGHRRRRLRRHRADTSRSRPAPPIRSTASTCTIAAPSFADLDGDGDLDAVVGATDGTLHYFKNTGRPSRRLSAEQIGAANPFNGVDVG